MNVRWIAVPALALLAGSAVAEEASPLSTPKQKSSYAIGMNVGGGLSGQLKQQAVDVDLDMLARGFKDALSGGQTLLTQEELRTTLTALQNEIKGKQEEARKTAGEKNKKEGETFLAENKGKEGVVTLASGLQYKVLKAGEGKKPTADDTVECHYKGTLIDGTEFDSSYKRNQPASFKVKGVIPGWTEALQLMPAGSKWQLFIPSNLAYGEKGAGRDIGPNAMLIFEVELLAVK